MQISIKVNADVVMYWFKHHNDFSKDPRVEMIIIRHKFHGYFALIRMFELLTEHLNVEDPENFLFTKRRFFSNLFPFCCQKTGKTILDYFQSLGFIKYKIINKEVLIKCKQMGELADPYTKRCARKKARKKS